MGKSLHKDPHIIKGSLFALCGYLCMALLSACSKGLPTFPLMQILFFQNCISCILTLPSVAMGEASNILKPPTPTSTSHGTLRAGLLLFVFLCHKRNSSGERRSICECRSPLVTLCHLFLAEKKGVLSHLAGNFLGLIGIILIIKPLSTPINLGVILGLASGMFLRSPWWRSGPCQKPNLPRASCFIIFLRTGLHYTFCNRRVAAF